jgi:hypothetical protein
MLGRSAGLGPHQFQVECNRDPAGDLVLQGEQIIRVTVEPLGPQMGVALGIKQLRADADPVTRPADASLQHIAHAQLAADLLRVDGLVTVCERAIARDHEAALDP